MSDNPMTDQPKPESERMRIAQLCQVEDCAKPILRVSDRNYLWIAGPSRIGEQIVVCPDCLKRFESKQYHEQ